MDPDPDDGYLQYSFIFLSSENSLWDVICLERFLRNILILLQMVHVHEGGSIFDFFARLSKVQKRSKSKNIIF